MGRKRAGRLWEKSERVGRVEKTDMRVGVAKRGGGRED